MSDYILESALWALYYEDLLFLGPVALGITTTYFNFALRNQLSHNGFADGMPCQVTVAAIDDVPSLTISHDIGL